MCANLKFGLRFWPTIPGSGLTLGGLDGPGVGFWEVEGRRFSVCVGVGVGAWVALHWLADLLDISLYPMIVYITDDTAQI